MGVRILQISDLHFANETLAEVDGCTAVAINTAIERGVDLAVITGDSTDHAVDVHSPAFSALAGHVRHLADHCPVLMLQGTFSHEPVGTLDVFRLLGGRFPVFVADKLGQVAWCGDAGWVASAGWAFETTPDNAAVLFTCLPTVNKGSVAAVVGALDAAAAVGEQLAVLLQGYSAINMQARAAGVPTVILSHGTVNGCLTEHGVPMAGFDHEFTTGTLFAGQAAAAMLGHIHRHQVWEQDGRLIAYPGSIGRLHYGEEGEKGGLLWTVEADRAQLEFLPVPARKMIDIVFDGVPDIATIRTKAEEIMGAFVRVTWSVSEESNVSVDRKAIADALDGAVDFKLEGRVIPVRRARAEGISQVHTLPEKVSRWSELSGIDAAQLVSRLNLLLAGGPEEVARTVLQDLSTAPIAAIETSIAPVVVNDVAEPQKQFELEMI